MGEEEEVRPAAREVCTSVGSRQREGAQRHHGYLSRTGARPKRRLSAALPTTATPLHGERAMPLLYPGFPLQLHRLSGASKHHRAFVFFSFLLSCWSTQHAMHMQHPNCPTDHDVQAEPAEHGHAAASQGALASVERLSNLCAYDPLSRPWNPTRHNTSWRSTFLPRAATAPLPSSPRSPTTPSLPPYELAPRRLCVCSTCAH